MNRIRYQVVEGEDGVVKSVQIFQHPNNGAQFSVFLNIPQLKYIIFDEVAGLPVVNGEAKSLQMLKIKAKKHLVKLGIDSFTKEGRTRGEQLV